MSDTLVTLPSLKHYDENIKEIIDNKQERLVGMEGQIVSFDANGNVISKNIDDISSSEVIDDYTIETDSTWSSNKISEEIAKIEDAAKDYADSKVVIPVIEAAAGSSINNVGTPSVTASTIGDTTTFTFNNLKGAKGDKGDKGDTGAAGSNGTTPTIKAAAGSNINTVGTPSVTASTSGTTTTFTFNNLKGAKGDKGDSGSNGTTPTIKAAAGSNINTVGTPSVSASTSGTTTTFTFNNLKGATGAAGTTPTIKAAAGSNINTVGTPSVTASTSGTTTTFTFNNLKGATGATGAAGYKKFPSASGTTSSQGTLCTLGSKQVVTVICMFNGGGSLSPGSYISGLTYNGSSWSSGTKSMSVGNVAVIANTGTSSTAINVANNGGLGLLVFGPM